MQHMTMLRREAAFQHSMVDSNFCLWERGGNIVHHVPPRKCYLIEKNPNKQMVASDQQYKRNLLEKRKAWQFFASST